MVINEISSLDNIQTCDDYLMIPHTRLFREHGTMVDSLRSLNWPIVPVQWSDVLIISCAGLLGNPEEI